jgi:hypothetical protein
MLASDGEWCRVESMSFVNSASVFTGILYYENGYLISLVSSISPLQNAISACSSNKPDPSCQLVLITQQPIRHTYQHITRRPQTSIPQCTSQVRSLDRPKHPDRRIH